MGMTGWRRFVAASVLSVLSTVGLVGTDGVGAATPHQVPALPALGPIYTTSPGPTAVTIEGSLNPNGSATTYEFNFGTTTAYGSTTPIGNAGAGTALVTVSTTLTNLIPGTSYHADLVATNSAGSVASGDLRFVTATDSTTTTPGGSPPPPTVAAQSLAAVPVTNPGSAFDSLSGVSCVAPSFCVAVGFVGRRASAVTPLIERWSGSSFTIVSSPATPGAALSAVSCSSVSNCLAVGRDGLNTYAEHWNGYTWRVVATPSPRSTGNDILNGVACPTSAACWAVGLRNGGTLALGALAEYWDGRTWRVVATPSPAGAEMAGVSCATAVDCWAVGARDATAYSAARPFSEQWNGRSWRVQSMRGTSGDALAVTCEGARACWAVSTARDAPVLELLQGSWQRVTVPPRASYDALACTSAHDCWAVGGGGALWNGRSWATATVAANGDALLGVSCLTRDRCIAVGVTGTAITSQRAIAAATRPW